MREKNLQKGGLSASYLEPDRDLESEEDLGAIKSSVRSRLSRRQGGDRAASESSGSESEGEGENRLIKAKEEQGIYTLMSICTYDCREVVGWSVDMMLVTSKLFN